MEILKILIAVLSSFLVLGGIVALAGTWLAPNFMDRPWIRRIVTGDRLDPSRSDRTIMSIWTILIGSYLMLSMLGQSTLSYVVFVAWLPFAFIVLKRTFGSRTKA